MLIISTIQFHLLFLLTMRQARLAYTMNYRKYVILYFHSHTVNFTANLIASAIEDEKGLFPFAITS